MNELNISILRSPGKSIVRRLLGVIYVMVAGLWLFSRIIFKDSASSGFTLPFLDVVYVLLFGSTGIVFIIEGSGRPISSWFGEAYIRIDKESLRIKKGVWAKEWMLLWSDIEQVEFSVIKIKFKLADDRYSELNYDNLEYEHIQELKKSIKFLAAEKNIIVILPT